MKYYIITGESSGDVHAANLVSEIKLLDKKSDIRAWGGQRLSNQNVSIAKDIKKTSFMGFWNVIKNLNQIVIFYLEFFLEKNTLAILN